MEAAQQCLTAFAAARSLGDTNRWFDFHRRPSAAASTFAWIVSPPARRHVRFLLWVLFQRLTSKRPTTAIVAVCLSFIDLAAAVGTFPGTSAAIPRPLTLGDTLADFHVTTSGDSGTGDHWGLAVVKPAAHLPAALLVRVLTANAAFSAEELNTFYGRYGFTRAFALDGRSGAPVDSESSRTVVSVESWRHPLYCFHFAVTVDSHNSAEAALREVFNPQLDVVAYAVPLTAPGAAPLSCLPPLSELFRANSALAAAIFAVSADADAATAARGGAAGSHGASGFVPDLLVDGIPYWTTPEQIREYFSQYGTVASVRIATDDRSGAFLGCALVRMRTFDEAVRASDMNGKPIGGYEVLCGVLDRNFDVVSIVDPTAVLHQSEKQAPVLSAVPSAITVRVGGPSRAKR
jgi:hypothetical protein